MGQDGGMSRITKGPWAWKTPDESSMTIRNGITEGPLGSIIGSDGVCVCDFGEDTEYYPSNGTPPNNADLRLILAAPDLLEAAIKLVGLPGPEVDPAWQEMRTAITKALPKERR